uniref:GED domain-containing protein n=1 Tax=Anolis carolinensis TaxID=28377 RepID=A0A803TAJ4_ANOCA
MKSVLSFLCFTYFTGIVTKPDLVDKGVEEEIVDIVQNQKVPLKKGYMIVKCRGQTDINKKVSLKDAIQNERRFFEKHSIFRFLGIEIFFEGLTPFLLVPCFLFQKSLPTLERQIKDKIEEANIKLEHCGQGVPETQEDQMRFLIEVSIIGGKVSKLRDNLTEVCYFEYKYRGKELPGFVSYKTFEVIVKQQIEKLKLPAVEMLKKVAACLSDNCMLSFVQKLMCYIVTQNNIDDIKERQEKKTESMIINHFKLESLVYCQDNIYSTDIKAVRENNVVLTQPKCYPPITAEKCSADEMSYHLDAYFKSAGIRLATQIPMIIQGIILNDFVEELQSAMIQLLQNTEQYAVLLQERKDSARERATLQERIKRLTKARQRLAKFPL